MRGMQLKKRFGIHICLMIKDSKNYCFSRKKEYNDTCILSCYYCTVCNMECRMFGNIVP